MFKSPSLQASAPSQGEFRNAQSSSNGSTLGTLRSTSRVALGSRGTRENVRNSSSIVQRAASSRVASRSSAPSSRAPPRESMYIVAVTENRLREIGIAAIDLKAPELLLSQFLDTHTYIHTVTKLFLYDPVEIIVPNTSANSDLSKLIQSKFSEGNFSTVQRKYFNESKGVVYLKEMVVPEFYSTVEIESASKYLCVAAAAALLKYVEFVQAFTFAPNSLKLSFTSCNNSMEMDSETIKNLEIISNVRDGKQGHSLFGVLKHTNTTVGTRLLKTTLVQPSCDANTLNGRLDTIEEFLNNQKMFFEVSEFLKKVLDLNHLITQTNLVQIPTTKSTITRTSSVIKNILYLKHTLAIVPKLANSIASSSNELLKAVYSNISNPSLAHIREEIDRIINEDAVNSKSPYHMRMQQCYAIKAGINGLLDVARKTLTETIEGTQQTRCHANFLQDMHSLLHQYREEYELPGMKLQFNTKRGHYLSLDTSNAVPLADIFIQVVHEGKRISFSTVQLCKINQRNQDSLNEIYLMTERVIEDLLNDIRKRIGAIYKLSDSIAFLDMMASFASYVTLSNTCTRPEFTDDGPLVIKQGRHPIHEKIFTEPPFIPNDTFVPETANFQIITGPNMSGKSTYIRQVALLTVLAHVGCYVPAQFASFRLTDRLFTRISTSDQIEANQSTFMREMIESAFIVKNATDRSLIIIDELGRGTSNTDGISISWAICEYLLSSKAMTFFVTHYEELQDLESIYPNVRNYHLLVDTTNGDWCFLFQLWEGANKDKSYGIDTAEKAGVPSQLIADARIIREQFLLKDDERRRFHSSKTEAMSTYYELVQRLKSLRNSTLAPENMKGFLLNLKEHYSASLAGTLDLD